MQMTRLCCAVSIVLLALASVKAVHSQERPFSSPSPNFSFTSRNLYGVNLAGAEQHAESTRPQGYDYVYPRPVELTYWGARGFGLVRVPFNISRLQSNNFAPLDEGQLGSLKAVVDYALQRHIWVLLDPHNFGYVGDSVTHASLLVGANPKGTAIFVDFWKRLATCFRNYPNVMFGLMNEPHDQSATQWRDAALAAHDAIRALGIVTQPILLQGTNWDGAHSWFIGDHGNGDAWNGWKGDPNVLFEVHQYLDGDSSGTHPACAPGVGAKPLIGVTQWARANHVRLFLGEFGWSPDRFAGVATHCSDEARPFMDYLTANRDVWAGWSYWNGGSWLFYGAYMYGIQPSMNVREHEDKPQLRLLLEHIGDAQ